MRGFLLSSFIFLLSCGNNEPKTNSVIEPKEQSTAAEGNRALSVAPVYAKYKVQKGFFAISDGQNGSIRYFNKDLATQAFSPMSTFKIPNTLIALESKAVKDETEVLIWDKQKRLLSDWNRDHDLRSAYKYSVLWFYQEVAKKVGKAKMQQYVTKFDYGNKDISGAVDQFWFDNSLKITADEQIAFLKKVHSGNLPVEKSSLNTLKEIMTTEKSNDFILRSKTGTGELDSKEHIGWYVGYIEKGKDVYFFASAVFGANANEVRKSRLQIVEEILREQCKMPSLKINIP